MIIFAISFFAFLKYFCNKRWYRFSKQYFFAPKVLFWLNFDFFSKPYFSFCTLLHALKMISTCWPLSDLIAVSFWSPPTAPSKRYEEIKSVLFHQKFYRIWQNLETLRVQLIRIKVWKYRDCLSFVGWGGGLYVYLSRVKYFKWTQCIHLKIYFVKM